MSNGASNSNRRARIPTTESIANIILNGTEHPTLEQDLDTTKKMGSDGIKRIWNIVYKNGASKRWRGPYFAVGTLAAVSTII